MLLRQEQLPSLSSASDSHSLSKRDGGQISKTFPGFYHWINNREDQNEKAKIVFIKDADGASDQQTAFWTK